MRHVTPRHGDRSWWTWVVVLPIAASAYGADTSVAEPRLNFACTRSFLHFDDGDPAPVDFPFTLRGAGPVSVYDVVPSCGCTRATGGIATQSGPGTIEVTVDPLHKQGVKPITIDVLVKNGARQRLEVLCDFTESSGRHRRPISAASSWNDLVDIDRRFVWWPMGSTQTASTVLHIRPLGGEVTSLALAPGSESAVHAELAKESNGWRLTLRPLSTAAASFTEIPLRIGTSHLGEVPFACYAAVK